MAPISAVHGTSTTNAPSEVERVGGDAERLGQRVEPAQPSQVERVDAADRVGQGDRPERNAELEDSVSQHGPADPRRDACRERGAEREPGHVGREHRHHGELRGAEHERELARPRRLVEQRGEPGQEEADEQERERHGRLGGSLTAAPRGAARRRAYNRRRRALEDGVR